MSVFNDMFLLMMMATVFAVVSSEIEPIEDAKQEVVTDKDVVRAVVESCGGWRLNRLPDVKAFIREDLQFFHNAEFKQIPHHNPDLVLLNAEDQVVERIDLSPFNREECNQLLISKGFYRKHSSDESVPEQFSKGPYVPTGKSDL